MALSIRARIVFSLVTALAVTGVVAAVATYFSAKAAFSELFDSELRSTALQIVARHSTDISNITLVGQSPQQEFLIQIYDAREDQLYQSRDASPIPLPDSEGFSEVTDEQGKTWRVFAVASGARVVQAAQPVQVRKALATKASLHLLQPLVIAFFFLAIAIWFVIVHALSSLNHAAKEVESRTPSSLDPIPSEGMPREVRSLVLAINALLERLSASLTAQQRFASDAAHELRTPLAAIKLQGQLLARAKTDEDRAKYSERLQQGIARATRLVQQLLTIARLDPEAKKPLSEVDLAELALSVHMDLEPLAEGKNITLTAKTSPVSLMGMPDALRLLITNLSDNALRYTPEGGRIEISVASVGTSARIEVADSGPGIPPEERARVFERFYRALGTKVSGTGLGLAIVHRIVELHGGKIQIEDGLERADGSGFGARFVVEIPLEPSVTLD